MRALILVDLQNDFMPGGALAVAEGDQTVAVANRLAAVFELVVATQDWQPENRGSFVTQHPGRSVGEMVELDGLPQVVWPVHCVRDTAGAAFHRDLDVSKVRVFHKGTDAAVDSYSGFFDNGHERSTGLAEWLREQGVDTVYVLGLATDYCVKLHSARCGPPGFHHLPGRRRLSWCRAATRRCRSRRRKDARSAGVRVVQSDEV